METGVSCGVDGSIARSCWIVIPEPIVMLTSGEGVLKVALTLINKYVDRLVGVDDVLMVMAIKHSETS
jgi:hypothetical protein